MNKLTFKIIVILSCSLLIPGTFASAARIKAKTPVTSTTLHADSTERKYFLGDYCPPRHDPTKEITCLNGNCNYITIGTHFPFLRKPYISYKLKNPNDVVKPFKIKFNCVAAS